MLGRRVGRIILERSVGRKILGRRTVMLGRRRVGRIILGRRVGRIILGRRRVGRVILGRRRTDNTGKEMLYLTLSMLLSTSPMLCSIDSE